MRAALPAVGRRMTSALGWTLAQHGAYFVSAWLVTTLAGAAGFGALGQALALSLIGSLAVTARLEYAAQLHGRAGPAQALFGLAERLAWVGGLVVAALAGMAWVLGRAPAWLPAGALAIAPLALLLVRASAEVRDGQVARAAAIRAGPALLMLPLQAAMAGAGHAEGVVWSVPAAAWLCWAWVAVRNRAVSGSRTTISSIRQRRVLRSRWRFVRAEWPSLMLNTLANHGQVLVLGALAGDVAAGVLALALRIAMLPTSLLGPALTDTLRARVVAAGTRPAARALVRRAWPWMVGASVLVHSVAWLLLPWACAIWFAPQGLDLVVAARTLLWLGALRLAISPLTFLLAWRGWVGINLLGQALLFAVALGAALWGATTQGGAPAVACAYAVAAAGVYVGYLVFSLRAVR